MGKEITSDEASAAQCLNGYILDIVETEYIFKEEKCNGFWGTFFNKSIGACYFSSLICFWELVLKYVAL